VTDFGDHPTSCTIHIKGSFPAVKQLGCEVDNSPLSSAAFKRDWSCITESPYMPAWHGQKQLYLISSFDS